MLTDEGWKPSGDPLAQPQRGRRTQSAQRAPRIASSTLTPAVAASPLGGRRTAALHGHLRPVFRVPLSSQLASRGGDADLELRRWPASGVISFDWRAFGSHGRARRGVLYQRVPVWRWSWRRTCEKFSEIIGLRHTCSHVPGVPGASEPRQQPLMPLWLVEGSRAEAQQNRLHDRRVIEERLGYRRRFHPRRDDQRRYPHAVASERVGVVVRRRRRRDVIEEAAVFVVEDDEERSLPIGGLLRARGRRRAQAPGRP